MVTHLADQKLAPTIEGELSEYSPLVRTLLANRGITKKEEAERFLCPDYARDIHDPFLLLGMEEAVERVLVAMNNNEHIVVYADYDCDGGPGAVLLHDLFEKIEYKNVEIYIPHRHDEGYGLHSEAVEGFAKKGAHLIITVDCGISDIESVARAQELGVDVIVTDHHLPLLEGGKEKLPPAYTVVNPKQEADTYPSDVLCGAGVAWKLSCALLARGKEREMFAHIPDEWEKWLLDMAGLATVADMVPLQKENRAIAHYGLKVLRKSRRPGLQKLLALARSEQAHLTEDDIAFTIAPRVNAASRMDDPRRAFETFAVRDVVQAQELARHLHTINDERKLLVARIMKEVKRDLAERELKDVVVIGNPEWRVGVLGIVAGNIVEEFGRPAFVWGYGAEDGILKGSCRSDGSVHIVELMRAVPDVFTQSGGHEFSGGFAVTKQNVHTLEDTLHEAYSQMKRTLTDEDKQHIDAELALDDVSWTTCNDIHKLAPFGIGNPKPVFSFPNIEIANIAHFGKDKNHLRLTFKNSRGQNVSAIGFFMTERSFDVPLEKGKSINLTAMIEKSRFRGFAELRLRIIDASMHTG